MARSKTGRITTVPPTAISSGAKVTDFIPLPLPIFLIYRTIAFWLKHWYIGALIILYFFIGWEWFVALLFSVPAGFLAFVWANNRDHHPRAIVKATVRMAYSRRLWKRTVEAASLNNGPYKPRLYTIKRPPRLGNSHGTALIFTLSLSRVGKTVTDIEKAQEYIVAGLQARRSRVKRITPGVAELTVEWDQRRFLPFTPVRIIQSVINDPNTDTQLPRVELDEDVEMDMDTSLLVVGESGSGKSNLTWGLVNSLNENNIDYRMYVIDPKQVELAALEHSPYTVMYVDRARDADKVVNAFHAKMEETLAEMKEKKLRKVKLGKQHPLHLLIIDELLLLAKVLNKGAADTPLAEILSIGRAAGFIIVANSQLGQVDTIGRIRDLFPQRVCMAVKSSDLTNAVLGPNAESRGARCTEITEKGVGYIYTDRMGNFQRFKPPLIADVETVASGGVYVPDRATRRLTGR